MQLNIDFNHNYEVSLKSNETGVTNNLFQFQTTNYLVSSLKLFA